MTGQPFTDRTEAMLAAIHQVYEDADVSPPMVGGGSRIVPLERLVAGQGLHSRERAGLTRGSAAQFLNERLRKHVELSGAAAEQLSGYLYGTLNGGEILVSRDDPITRRRFTVAHELGHYVLHALPLLEAGATIFSEAQPGGRSSEAADTMDEGRELGERGDVRVTGGAVARATDIHRWETEANQFAAELLMPEALCRALVDQFRDDFGDGRKVLAKRLGSELLVSQAAMTNRLETLGLGRV